MNIIELAKEAGFDTDIPSFKDGTAIALKLADLVRAEALEDAAKWFEDEEHPLQPKKVAAAIRGLK